jgi:hypothetical protein
MNQKTYTSAGHRKTGALRSLWGFTLGAFLAGCYRNVPVADPAQLQAGAQVRVQFSLEGSRQMERQLGPEVRSVSGKVDTFRGDTLFLLLQESRTINGQILPSSGNRIAIARPLIADFTERVQNRRRSIIAAVVALGSAIAILVIASGALGGGGSEGTLPPPPPPT